MVQRPRIRDATAKTLEQIKEENEYGSTDRAIAHALREAGYDL